ncbi:MAG: hypothetical protein N3E50_05490 [Candidatus Goldbacteria bacterium]|nr:hypothetical protein [Candidatus Goldiibacteriota bacterium]
MKKSLILPLSLIIIFLTACAVPFHKKLDQYLSNDQFKEADELIESEKTNPKENIYSSKNELLYYFDKGAVRQMMGDYKTSSENLEKAEDIIDKLYTKSLTDETWSFFSNDLNLNYTGEDFEQVMVNIIKALNYMYEDNFEGAAIEARKINHKLNYFQDSYGDKAIYTDDAFARYLSAFAYEAIGAINDAYIDYKKSLKAYQKYNSIYGTEIPEFIKCDIFRMADALKFYDHFENFKREWGDIGFIKYNDLKKASEVMIVIYDGLPAYKIDDRAMPKFVHRGYAVEKVIVKDGDKSYSSVVAQDVSKMAIKNLENKNLAILAKTLVRNVAKKIAKDIPILNLFIGEEKADTRCWRTIPARFQIVRFMVIPESKRKIIAEIYIKDKKDPIQQIFEIYLKPGKKKVIPIYMFR